jgi:hypothetical protein
MLSELYGLDPRFGIRKKRITDPDLGVKKTQEGHLKK